MSDSIWDNVAFDHAAAREAAGALEDAASRLDQVSRDRAGQARRKYSEFPSAGAVPLVLL